MYALATLPSGTRALAPVRAAAPAQSTSLASDHAKERESAPSRGRILQGLLVASYYDAMQRGLQFELNKLTGKRQSLADLTGWTLNQAV